MRKEKQFFYPLFLFVVLILLTALYSLNHYLADALDDNLIIAVTTVIVIVLLVLFFFGVFLSWWLIGLAQKNLPILKRLTERHTWVFCLLNLNSRDDLEKTVRKTAQEQSVSVDEEMLAAIRKPKRRGRPSNYPHETMHRTVLAWENRGPNFPYTLAEFLDERFDSSPTGVPNVPNGTFYDWRTEILSELKKDEKDETQKT